MPPELVSRQAIQPWMVIVSVLLASGWGLWCQLGVIAGGTGQQSATAAADSLSRVWHEGGDSSAALDEARARSSEVLEDVLQSQLGLFFLASLFLSCYALGALVTKALFLGQLSIIETTKLAERMLKFVMLKVVFLGAVVNPDPQELGTWLLWFSVMAYFRAFVGLARDRCEALLSSPSARPLQHARCLALLGGLLGQACSWVASYCAASGPAAQPAAVSHALLWLFDAVCVAVEAAHALLKYGVHAAERWAALHAEAAAERRRMAGRLADEGLEGDDCDPGTEPVGVAWEGKGPFLYHVDVCVDVTLHLMTLAHYCHLWWLHGLRLQLIDAVLFLDVRYLAAGTLRRVRGYARYRRLTHQLQHSFPLVPASQLAGRDCAICMERLKSARALPCGHVFHLGCLRAWLQQARGGEFTCPLCRASLEVGSAGRRARVAAPRPATATAAGSPPGMMRIPSAVSAPAPLYALLAGRSPSLSSGSPAPSPAELQLALNARLEAVTASGSLALSQMPPKTTPLLGESRSVGGRMPSLHGDDRSRPPTAAPPPAGLSIATQEADTLSERVVSSTLRSVSTAARSLCSNIAAKRRAGSASFVAQSGACSTVCGSEQDEVSSSATVESRYATRSSSRRSPRPDLKPGH